MVQDVPVYNLHTAISAGVFVVGYNMYSPRFVGCVGNESEQATECIPAMVK